jgi:major vault protein
VVFPKPTEKFKEGKGEDGQSSRKFRAIELNPIQGIHLKVIADFEENGKKFKAGEELFVTGKDSTIFYPREELATIKYDGKTKSYAVAVPAGEARYVMDRMKGDIKTVTGPAMLLPDPRTEVIAQRILTDKQCDLWYPGNAEAKDFNQKLRPVVAQVPTTRGGVPSAGDLGRVMSRGMKGLAATESMLSANYAMIADSSLVSKDQSAEGDEFSRSASFTAPRSITLNTKFHGVPMIDVWTGFAVMVVSKSGKRRVEVGPKTVLLDYDETLEVLELSTGKPKTTDNLQKTVYLRVENNQVTDIIRAETVDHVQVEMKLSYRVNFKGDPTKWFTVDNYIKYLCDHERSIVKGSLKKTPVEDFYKNSTDIIRELILGKATGEKGEKKPAHTFPNGMEITDVEVLGVTIADDRIRSLLDASQTDVVKSNIEVAMLQRNLKVTGEKAQVTREIATIENQTMLRKNALETEAIKSTTLVHLQALASKLEELEKTQALSEEEQGLKNLLWDSDLAREKKAHEQRNAINAASQALQVALMQVEADTLAKKFSAVGDSFSEALLSLSNNDTLEKVAKALSIQTVLGGNSLADALQKAFTGTTVAGTVKKLLTNGESSGKTAPTA